MRRALLALALAACNPQVSVGLSVDWSDPCLLAFPGCYGACSDSHGDTVAGCETACVGGREVECRSDGPHCVQTVGLDQTVETPILCVSPAVYRP